MLAAFWRIMTSTADSTSGDRSKSLKDIAFPQFPGEDFLAHAASQYIEQRDARLTALKLTSVANGGDPPSVKHIIDIDLGTFPHLPVGHRD